MTELSQLSARDLEQLSAYADGELSERESDRLRARLESDPDLRQALQQLRATVSAMRGLAPVQRPRSFALAETTRRRAYPVLQLSTALAGLALILFVGADVLLRSAAGAPEAATMFREELEAPVEADRLAEMEASPLPSTSEPAQEGMVEFADPAEEPASDLAQAAPESEESPAEFAAQAPAAGRAADADAESAAAAEGETFQPTEGESESAEATSGEEVEQAVESLSVPPPSDEPAGGQGLEQEIVSREDNLLLSFVRIGEVVLGLTLLLLIGFSLRARRR